MNISGDVHGNCALYLNKKRATDCKRVGWSATLTYIHLGLLTMNIWQPHRKHRNTFRADGSERKNRLGN